MQRIGEFEIEKELGRGASATIYLAHHTESREKLSLKVFHSYLAEDSHFAQRIRREFRVLASLHHENIVAVRSMLPTTGHPAFTMDFIDGENLERFQSRLPYTLPEVSVLIVIEILKALEYAHSHDVIHRDLKPENVLIRKDGRVFVTDFGLAKLQDASTIITQPNHIMGSAEYMSPEQTIGDVLTPLSDLFAVAVILYFLTTGTRPFSRSTSVSTLNAIREEAAEAPEKRNPKLSGELSRIIQKGLAKDPQLRFQSAAEFAKALSDYLSNIGLSAEAFSLPLWIRDPVSATMDSLRMTVEKLTRSADAASKTQQWNLCLEYLAHLSLKAPESPAISRLTELMKDSRKHRAAWYWGFGLGIAALLGGALLWLQRTSPTPPSPEASRSETIPSKNRLGEVRFNVGPGVDVVWDGKSINPSAPLKDIVFGKHELLLKQKGSPPIRTQIWIKNAEPVVINAR